MKEKSDKNFPVKNATADTVSLFADDWIDDLIAWADANEIAEKWNAEQETWLGLPRDKQEILRLTELTLWNSRFTELPESIGNLSNLEMLCLIGNKLTKIPESIGQLQYLECIDLGENPIKELPPHLAHLGDIINFEVDSEY